MCLWNEGFRVEINKHLYGSILCDMKIFNRYDTTTVTEP